MQNWEYRIAASILNDKNDKWLFVCGNQEYKDSQTMLNSLGSEGWELVSTTAFDHTSLKGLPRMPSTYTFYIEMYFKRPKA